MSATIPSQWNVLHPLTPVPSAQRNETMLTSHARSVQSSSCAEGSFFARPICIRTRLATQARCTPEVSFTSSVQSLLSHPLRHPNRISLLFQRFNSTCCQSRTQPAHLMYAVLQPRYPNRIHHRGCLAFSGRRDGVPPSSGASQSPKSHQDMPVGLNLPIDPTVQHFILLRSARFILSHSTALD